MATQKYLWTCELTKDKPIQKWQTPSAMELEEENDSDFVIHSLILKSAMLGAKAVDGERSIVAVKTKGIDDNEIEQPLFSLTYGRNDMISNFDLHLGTRHPIEFKLVEGAGPVYITCTHLTELPPPDEQNTLMTTTDAEDIDDDIDEEEEAECEKDGDETGGEKRMSAAMLKMKNGKKNGTEHANGESKEVEVGDEKPNKRKRN